MTLLLDSYEGILLSMESHKSMLLPLLLDSYEGIVGMVGDWSNMKNALGVGCERWILLNAVEMQLKKEGSNGRIVGMDLWHDEKETMSSMLKTTTIEGVQEYVTC
jgi:hypothetical protein